MTKLVCHSLCLLAIFLSQLASAENIQTGVTQLTVYEVPEAETPNWLSFAKSAAQKARKDRGLMYLFHKQPDSDDGVDRYFIVEFPDDIHLLTEPNTASYPLVSQFGHFRTHTELTRQVIPWCSTTNINSNKLPNAHTRYFWLKPNSLGAIDQVLRTRADIVKQAYGSGSDGVSAFEGFMPMAAPFTVMIVHFSSETTLDAAQKALLKDLEAKGLLEPWLETEVELSKLVIRESGRSGKFIADLSVF